MKARLLLSAAALLVASTFATQAKADTALVEFRGIGIDANLTLTYGASTDAKYPDAFEITGITGTFTDTNHGLNIVNATIIGLVPITNSTPEPGNLLAPNDFSRFAVASGLGPQSGGFLTYDNLFWPGGAGPTATDYPAAGGLFDIYGLMFEIGNGTVVDIWSNGTFVPGGPFSYGVGVANSQNALDYVGGNVALAPEPSSIALLGTGLFGMVGVVRRKLKK